MTGTVAWERMFSLNRPTRFLTAMAVLGGYWLPDSHYAQAESKLLAVAKLALKKAIDHRPDSVPDLAAILGNIPSSCA